MESINENFFCYTKFKETLITKTKPKLKRHLLIARFFIKSQGTRPTYWDISGSGTQGTYRITSVKSEKVNFPTKKDTNYLNLLFVSIL